MDAWVERQLDGGHLPDQRLKTRLGKLLGDLGRRIGGTVPLACQDWAATKAAYRFFDNPRVDEGAILGGHFAATTDRFAATPGTVLVLHDTTEFSFRRDEPGKVGRVCRVKARRTFHTVCGLLAAPDRVRREYEVRRSQRRAKGGRASDQVGKLIAQVKRGIARLIDAYEEGLLEKAEFEPRLREARARLTKLQGEAESAVKRESEEAELAAAIGQLEGFAERVRSGLQSADWNARREILRALVKRVEIGADAVKVVYKVDPRPFDQDPSGSRSQHCGRGDHRTLRCPDLRLGPLAVLGHARPQPFILRVVKNETSWRSW